MELSPLQTSYVPFLGRNLTTMTKIRHRFINHTINPKTETLIIGTFNPDTEGNSAEFFYGRQRNFLWTLLSTAFNETSLKGQSKEEKLKFIEKYRIDFIDLISEVEVSEVANYKDGYLDNKVLNGEMLSLKSPSYPT